MTKQVKLPLFINDPVYIISRDEILEDTVYSIVITNDGNFRFYTNTYAMSFYDYMLDSCTSYFFSTKERAEEELLIIRKETMVK